MGELIRRQNTKRITCIIPAKENITCELQLRRNQLKSTALAAIAYLKCCDFNRVHCSHKHRRGEWLHLPRRNNSKRRKESPLRVKELRMYIVYVVLVSCAFFRCVHFVKFWSLVCAAALAL